MQAPLISEPQDGIIPLPDPCGPPSRNEVGGAAFALEHFPLHPRCPVLRAGGSATCGPLWNHSLGKVGVREVEAA